MIRFVHKILHYEYYNDNVLLEVFRNCTKDSTFSLIRLHEIVYARLMEVRKDEELAESDTVELIANVLLPMLSITRANYQRILSLMELPLYNSHPAVRAIMSEDFSPKFSYTSLNAA